MVQVTPRLCQNDLSPVFPVTPGPPVLTQEGRCESRSPLSPAVGMIYFGRKEVSFKGSIIMAAGESCTLVCELSTISAVRHYRYNYGQYGNNSRMDTVARENLQEEFNFNGQPVKFNYQNFNVILNSTGAHIMLQSTDSPLSVNPRTRSISKSLELPFRYSFPWLITFGLTHNQQNPPVHSFTFTFPTSHA